MARGEGSAVGEGRTRSRRVARRAVSLAVALATVLVAGVSAAPLSPGAAISGFSPAQGANGVHVVITGAGLAGTSRVRFAGTDAAFSVDSDTQLTATVPAGAVSGRIRVRTADGSVTSATPFTVIPIRHVVIVYQENHSFDNVLGLLCLQQPRCDGVSEGTTSDGSTVPLTQSPDIVPAVAHDGGAQKTATDGGKMDAFDLVNGCGSLECYAQYAPDQIPSLATLAESFVISDRTFEISQVASWPAHIELAASTTDGFLGGPHHGTSTLKGPGWGCDSGKDAMWKPPASPRIDEPTCIPKPDGSGPYRPSDVPWVPTIMDRLDAAGFAWKLYTPQPGKSGYGWAVCPTFADCLYSPQAANVVPSDQVVTDAQNGTLPSFSAVIPSGKNSQHNNDSMLVGDNWISTVVTAIEDGPDWSSTAVFITYDDCGCFFDHVKPPKGLSIRVPMVIVSPYAKPSWTDSNNASFASMLAYTEDVFGLPALGTADAAAYDYEQAFDYSQRPLAPVRLTTHRVPRWELRFIAAHPPDPHDPT